MLEAEALGHQVPEAPYAEGLGGVMTRRDEVDARLASLLHGRLGRLPGEERVEAGLHRLAQAAGASARDDADRAHSLRAGLEHQRTPAGEPLDAGEDVRRGEAVVAEA